MQTNHYIYLSIYIYTHTVHHSFFQLNKQKKRVIGHLRIKYESKTTTVVKRDWQNSEY